VSVKWAGVCLYKPGECCADEHCIQLVESDFAGKLLRLFERNPVDTGSPVTHHAVLSALRNLAIPGLQHMDDMCWFDISFTVVNIACFVFITHSKLPKVPFLVLFVYEISRKLLNRFVPNSHGRHVWCLTRTSLNVKVKGQGQQGQSFSPLKMHCNAHAANNVMQQQTGPFHRCQGVMGVHSSAACDLCLAEHL